MFECGRCTARALRALLQNAPLHMRSSHRPSATASIRDLRQRRSAVSLSQARIQQDDKDLPFDASTESLGISPVPKRHLQLELRGLADKFAIAEHVYKMLMNKKEFDKALALVRLASSSDRHGQCTVAWNHLIRYAVEHDGPEKAWNLFNDMKKRAQFPDSHTYIALFKGFNRSQSGSRPRPSQKNASRVVSIYNSMYAPNSRCKPSVIHANAALQTCSLAGDIDSIWAIVSKLDEEGPNSADGITYTVLLNSIRTSAVGKMAEAKDDLTTVQAIERKAIQDGVDVWRDIVKKWTTGQVVLDEKVVIAMAQLLLISSEPSDQNCVFRLMEQTMDIPIAPSLEEGFANPTETQHTSAFEPLTGVTNKKSNRVELFSYTRPSQATLSILMETCFRTRITQVAKEYWEILEGRFRVTPDLVNLEHFLRLCSASKASTLAVEHLAQALVKHNIRPRLETLDLAMSICFRDQHCPQSVTNAGKIIDVMLSHFDEPEVLTVAQYLQLAMIVNKGRSVQEGLAKLKEPADKLALMAVQGSANAQKRANWPSTLEGISALFQAMIGTIDTLLVRNMVATEQRAMWEERRTELTKAVGTVKKRLEALGLQQTVGTRRSTAATHAPTSLTRMNTNTAWTTNLLFTALQKFRKNLPTRSEPPSNVDDISAADLYDSPQRRRIVRPDRRHQRVSMH